MRPLAPRTLAELARGLAQEFGPEPALLSASGEGLGFAELGVRVEAGAGELRSRGLEPGDRVLLAGRGDPHWVLGFLAAARAGLVVVPLPPELPPELPGAWALQARALIRAPGPRESRPGSMGVFEAETLGQRGGEPPSHLPGPGDPVLLAPTSGSTARPRIVELSHGNLCADLRGLVQVMGTGPGDVFLDLLPPAHLFSLVGGILGPFCFGACVLFPSSLLPNRVLALARERGATHALVVPGLLEALLSQALAETGEGSRFQGRPPRDWLPVLEEWEGQDRLRPFADSVARVFGPPNLIGGGAAFSPDLCRAARLLGLDLAIGYGLTEASPVVSLGRSRDMPEGSVGRPLPGIEVRVDPSGEVLVRGETVMQGYFGDPAETSRRLRGGWLRTGDRGRFDAGGFLFLEGRIEEAMVTASGRTLFPEEMEAWYRSQLFRESAIVPLPDGKENQVPCLVVVPRSPDAGVTRVELARLRALAPPAFRVYEFRHHEGPLPRTPAGKLRRRSLREELERKA